MKVLTSKFLAALAGLLLLAPVAPAALSYTDGDLIMAFRGTSSSYLINLGSVTQFQTGSLVDGNLHTLSLSGVNADLMANFGSSWGASGSTLVWSLQGSDPFGSVASPGSTATVWISQMELTAGTASPALQNGSQGALQGPAGLISDMANAYATGTATANNPKGLLQSNTAANSYRSYQSGGVNITTTAAYDYFSTTPEGSFSNGAATNILDLYQLDPALAGANALRLGAFRIDATTGAIQFSSDVTDFKVTAGVANVALSQSTYSANEGSGAVATITINRTGDLTGAFDVMFTTTPGTATAGTDYTTTNKTVSFAANDTSKTVDVPILLRPGFQANRSFTVGISVASGATAIAPTSATVTIIDSTPNPAGKIAFSTSSYSAAPVNNMALPNKVTVTLNRTSGTSGQVKVDVSLATGGTLTSGTDFTFTSPTTITFADTVATKTFDIQLSAIDAAKLPGTIKLSLGNPTNGAALGTIAAATVTVTAPDKVLPTVVAAAPKPPITASVNLTGTASDNAGIDHVEVSVNGGTPQNATLAPLNPPVTGKMGFTLTGLAPENGKNTILITAVDTSGNRSKPAKLAVTYVNARPEIVGPYYGLLVPAVTPTNDLSGLVTFAVGKTGTFTGKVLISGVSLPIGGIIGNDGKAHFNPLLGTSLALSAKHGTTVVALGSLAFTVDTVTPTTGVATGTLKNGSNATVANLSLNRSFYDGKTPATSVDAAYVGTKGTGIANVMLPSKTQSPAAAHTTYPQGDGVATLTITKKGFVVLKGTLADGTTFSAAAPLSKANKAPLFTQLYAGKVGSLGGQVTLNNTLADSDVKGTNFLWFRPAIAKSKYYPNGWPNAGVIKTDLLGALYTAPKATVPGSVPILIGLKPVDTAAGNVTLQFSDGKLTSMQTKNANITNDAFAKASVTKNGTVFDPTVTFKLTPASGLVSGVFLHTDNTKPAYKAMLYQKAANKGAYGFFLSVVPASMPGTGESGGITLTVK